MARDRLPDMAYWLQAPAPLMAVWLASLRLSRHVPGPATDAALVAGTAAATWGVLLVAVCKWPTPHRAPAVVAVLCVAAGVALGAQGRPAAGTALVLLGLGMSVWVRDPRGLWVGALAAVGAIMPAPAGPALMLAAGPWLAWEAGVAARDKGQHLGLDAVPG